MKQDEIIKTVQLPEMPATVREAWDHASGYLLLEAAPPEAVEAMRAAFYCGMTYGATMAATRFVEGGAHDGRSLVERVTAGLDNMVALNQELYALGVEEQRAAKGERVQ